MNFGHYPESIFGYPHITDEDVETINAMTQVFATGAEQGSLEELGRMMRAEPPIERLHNFILMHDVHYIEVIKNDNHRQHYTNKEEAWENIVGSMQQGWRITQAEVLSLESPVVQEFGSPVPIPLYDAGRKIVINLYNPHIRRESNMATRGPRVITLEYLHDWMMGRQAHAWVIHIDGLADGDMAYADRIQTLEACRPFLERGYRITQIEQRLMHAPDWTVGDWEHPIPNIPEEYNVHINLESPSRFYAATAAVPEERMPRTEINFNIEIANGLQQQARDELIRAFGLPVDTLTSGSTGHLDFGPTAGSCFQLVGGRRGGAVHPPPRNISDWGIFPDEASRQDRKRSEESKKAKEKALKLFMECLNEQELNEFKTFSTVTVWSKIGVFRIDASTDGQPFGGNMPPTYNVFSGEHVYCVNVSTPSPRTDGQNVVQSTNFPFYDHILAQMLVLKTNPKKFVEIANKRAR